MNRYALLACLALAACEAPAPNPNPPKAEQAPTPADFRFSARTMIAPDIFAVVFDPSSDRSAVEKAARDLCGSRQWCKVLGWTDEAFAGRAFPLTDREADATALSLTINRASGLDEAVWP